jgi:hypothetical protein
VAEPAECNQEVVGKQWDGLLLTLTPASMRHNAGCVVLNPHPEDEERLI